MYHYLHLFVNYLTDGGIWIMIPIFLVSVVGWYLIIGRHFEVNAITTARKNFIKMVSDKGDDPKAKKFELNENYDYLYKKIDGDEFNKKSFFNFYREFLITTVPTIDKNFSAISTWVTISPLLGLLGTVSGMIETFKIITEFGLGNPNLTAQGISIALITTQAGLFVAFPLIVAQNYEKNRARKLKNDMFKDGEILIKRYTE